MKVTIGPYTNDDSERQIDIQIDSYDTWSMDHTLAMIILPMLRQLKETQHGAPNVDDDDVPDHLKSISALPKENDWDIDSNHFPRWEWVMDEMIWGFEQIVNHVDPYDLYSTGNAEYLRVAVDPEGNRIGDPITSDEWFNMADSYDEQIGWEIVHGPNHSLVIDDEKVKEWSDRLSNSLRFFGKYYQSLWD